MTFLEKKYKSRVLQSKGDNNLFLLISICLIAFVMLAFVEALWYFKYQDHDTARQLFSKNVMGLFTLPASLSKFFHQPWSLLTSFFVSSNNSFWKVFPNMFWLWSFGFILQDLTGGRKVIPVFIYGAFGAAISFLPAYNFLPSLHDSIGAASFGGLATGVMAVAVVTTLVSPGYRLFPMIAGGIPLWVLTGLYLVSDFATVSISDTATLITHIGAAVTGLLYFVFLQRGYDWSEWMNNFFDWVGNLFEPGKPGKNGDFKDQIFYKSGTTPYVRTARVTAERIDEILDKINSQGYDSLDEEEREMLRRAGETDL